ncbi:hypothetical protein KXD40_004899 [Peronospora effusa]|uniref:CBF1-interacting co-repressor CIR N-terminal domain-containing protein n=1 Tax=Peronospora effusa TaxID=542832 RepID=A0A425CK53_9STRA|nr:hypothetical protein DD237_001370 [Peronospora effusa]UIZ22266.1 hypothetical protein KXD40_004899 [Peronospora effusa]CAI5708474.1 unnamed protein product [Peronospora effusa]
MGGGGLRILPHKKWHVWRRENIERVLKDEREDEEKQKDLEVKKRRLEQEQRAQQLLLTEGHEDHQPERQHINFFKVEEAQMSRKKGGKHGKKTENVSDETLRRYGKLPWYARPEDAQKKELTVKQERKRKRELEVADPLQQMRPKEKRGQCSLVAARLEDQRQSRYGENEDGPAGCDRRKYDAQYDCSTMSPGHRDRRHFIEEDEEFGKALSERTRHGKKKSKSKHKLGKDALLQTLRRERQERETYERQRAERIMHGG